MIASKATTPRSDPGLGMVARLFPLLFFEAYLSLTLLLFAFGPVPPEFPEAKTVWAYAIIGQAFIVFGYLAGLVGRPRRFVPPLQVQWILKISIAVSVIVLLFSLKYRNYADLSLLEALENPGTGYRAKQLSLIFRESTPIFSVVRAAAGPFLALFVPAGILYWRRLSIIWRVLWFIGVVGWLGESLVTGSSKGIFDLVLVLPWFLWLAWRHTPRRRVRPMSPYRRAIPAIAAIILLLLGIEAFSHFTRSRSGALAGEFAPERVGWSQRLYGIDLSEALEHRIYMVSRYLSFGYNGLAGSLQLPFEWSKGTGHSGFLARWLAQLSSDPKSLLASNYPARLEVSTGYDASALWHTIYPWLASDLTFPGALVFIALMAFLFSRAWGDCLRSRNLFAAAFLMQLILMFYYIPANNIRLMFSEELVAFWSMLLLWLLTRQRAAERARPGVAQTSKGLK